MELYVYFNWKKNQGHFHLAEDFSSAQKIFKESFREEYNNENLQHIGNPNELNCQNSLINDCLKSLNDECKVILGIKLG